MHAKVYLPSFTVGLALTFTPSLHAAQPLPLGMISLPQLKQKFSIIMPGEKNVAALNGLRFEQKNVDKNHIVHLRLQQTYAGYKVFGGYAILHAPLNNQNLLKADNVTMNGRIYESLKEELGDVPPYFASNSALALEQLKGKYQSAIVQKISDEIVLPIIYIDESNNAHWAYQVSFLVEYTNKIPERPTVIVDAKTLQSFIQWNDVKTRNIVVKAKGYGGNTKVGKHLFGKDFPLLDISRNEQTNRCLMETPEVKVVDMGHKYSSQNRAMSFACKLSNEPNVFWTGYHADGYDKINGAYSPSNDALYGGYVIKHLYHEWYNLDVLTKTDGSPMQLVMRVHYGESYENAYWDGKQMTFGDGEYLLYPLVSLGVGAHEISHGFTDQHSSLEYFGQSGGMNESFSDMAAQAAEYYSTKTNTWMIGSEIMKENSGYEALRFMDKPSRDGTSIDSADEYYGGLDVHYSSGVYNRLFYLIANTTGWNTRKAFDVMVKANTDYWTPYSTFDEGGCGVLSAAKDLNYSLEDIKKALATVAINYASCAM